MQYGAYKLKFEMQNRNFSVIFNTLSCDFSYLKGNKHHEFQKFGKVHLFSNYNI